MKDADPIPDDTETPRFSDEYIAICRKLALPRMWQTGDWYITFFPTWHTAVQLHQPNTDDAAPPQSDVESVWVPLEGDWLDLLMTDGSTVAVVTRFDGGHHGASVMLGPDPANEQADTAPIVADAHDRLLALARLYAEGHQEST